MMLSAISRVVLQTVRQHQHGPLAQSFMIAHVAKRFASTTRLYTEKHEWICLKDDQTHGRVGISNHAQEALGDVVYVQLPDVGSKFAQFDEVGAIESVKAASELLTPVSGQITSVNELMAKKPGLANTDCYEQGWLYELKLDDTKELDKLMTEEQYNKYLGDSQTKQS